MLLALLQETTNPLGTPSMTTAGWAFMGLAWLFVIGLVVWCFWRVLGGPKPS